jgi:hypothetical protein
VAGVAEIKRRCAPQVRPEDQVDREDDKEDREDDKEDRE